MIEHVHIRGIRCLKDVKTTLAPFTVLIGPNDAGKSTFLGALSQLRPPTRRLEEPFFDASDALIEIQFDTIARGANTLRLKKKHGQLTILLTGPGVTQPARSNQDFEVLSHYPQLLASQVIVIDPKEIAERSPPGLGNIDALLQSRGRGVAAHLARLALGDRARFEAVQAALREVTGGRVLEFSVGEAVGGGYPLSFRLHDGTVIPARHLSQGLLVYLFFLALVHREDAPGVLLIEEPENGIHPRRLHEIVRLLRTLTARGVQIVLTTHSPDLLSACDPSEVRVFLRPSPESSTEIHALPDSFGDVAMGDSLGQIWASLGEDGLLDRLPAHEPRVVRGAG